MRTPIKDDVLPLTKPIVGTSGRIYTELPIPKGTPITVSTIGYNWCVFFTLPQPVQCAHICVFLAGTRICGVQMLACFDRSGGSK